MEDSDDDSDIDYNARCVARYKENVRKGLPSTFSPSSDIKRQLLEDKQNGTPIHFENIMIDEATGYAWQQPMLTAEECADAIINHTQLKIGVFAGDCLRMASREVLIHAVKAYKEESYLSGDAQDVFEDIFPCKLQEICSYDITAAVNNSMIKILSYLFYSDETLSNLIAKQN